MTKIIDFLFKKLLFLEFKIRQITFVLNICYFLRRKKKGFG